MSNSKSSSPDNLLLSFLGGLIVILLFVAVIYFGYLPHKSDPIDFNIEQERILKANDSMAEGISKLNNYKVLDADKKIYQIPIESASFKALQKYRSEL
jgi:hypothetical protein